jgi:hypothetical protein
MPTETKLSFADWYEAWIAFSRDKWLKAIAGMKLDIVGSKRELKRHLPGGTDPNEDYVHYDQNRLENRKTQLKELRIKQKQALKLTYPSAEDTFKKLTKHPRIVSVIVDGSNLRIATKHLYHDSNYCDYCQNPDGERECDDCEDCRENGCEHCNDSDNSPMDITEELGRFDIQICKEGSVGCDRVYNMDYYYDSSIDHPHIKDGRCCLGTYIQTMETYRDKGLLFLLVDTYIHYLQEAHKDDDAYVNMDTWISDRERRNRDED